MGCGSFRRTAVSPGTQWGLVVTLGVLAAVAVVLSFDRSFAVAYLVAWAVFHVAFSVHRYVKAVRRRTSDDTGKAPLPSNP